MKHHAAVSPFISGTTVPFRPAAGTAEPPTQALAAQRLAVKDVFDMAGLPTSAGNPDWLLSHPAPQDTNTSVSRLLNAGARFIGKTITDELAYSLNGQNIHYGTPQNPCTPTRLPGGSSSGSAVAVAAGLADIGLGTDTGGSIRVPASYNGLYGLRPTHGVIPCDNMVALAPSFDTVGWMCKQRPLMRSVAKVLLPYQQAAKKIYRIGVVQELFQASPLALQLNLQLEAWQHAHPALGFEPVSLNLLPTNPGNTFKVLQGAQIALQHQDWLESQKPLLADDIQARLDWCRGIPESQINQAQDAQAKWCKHLAAIFKQYDALVLPTTPGLAPLLATPASSLGEYREALLQHTAIAGLAGLPQLHLPCCNQAGVPHGLSLIGTKNNEFGLLDTADVLME
ncbi:amidase [Salinimonas sediminis]|uniref:Amidase n=1 Tax=Salinimonas sediminis TaxID=2303538 RepID=A0A346NKY6_9ALTE|nr:amidase [Salinimonas sediminis]AXR06193.1 amidase [Salinimonas sediminis]